MKKQLFFVALLMVMISCGNSGQKENNNRISKDVIEAAQVVNAMCPYTLDSETRLDCAIPLPNNTLQYNYTMVNYTKELLDTVVFKAAMEPQILNNVRTNPQMEYQRQNKWTLNYFYLDKDGNYICSIIATPEKYK